MLAIAKPATLIQRRETDDRALSMSVALSFAGILVVNLAAGFLAEQRTLVTTVSWVVKGLVALGFLVAVPAALRRDLTRVVVAVLAVSLLYAVQVLLHPERSVLTRYLVEWAILCLPPAVFGSLVGDRSVLYRTLVQVSRPLVATSILVLVYSIGFKSGYFGIDSYSMGYSYAILTPTAILLDSALRRRAWLDLLLVAVATVSILLLGSRGSLLCLGVYGLLFLVQAHWRRRGFWWMAIPAIGFLALGVVFARDIAALLVQALDSVQLSSRSLRIFATQHGLYMAGRDRLFDQVLPSMVANFWLGNGIGADVALLRGYVHNVVVELSLAFGVVVGIGLSLAGMIWGIRRILVQTDTATAGLDLVLFSLVFPFLMVSGTLWTYDKFWIWLFLGLTMLKGRTR